MASRWETDTKTDWPTDPWDLDLRKAVLAMPGKN
jgi:hypothetical protein